MLLFCAVKSECFFGFVFLFSFVCCDEKTWRALSPPPPMAAFQREAFFYYYYFFFGFLVLIITKLRQFDYVCFVGRKKKKNRIYSVIIWRENWKNYFIF